MTENFQRLFARMTCHIPSQHVPSAVCVFSVVKRTWYVLESLCLSHVVAPMHVFSAFASECLKFCVFVIFSGNCIFAFFFFGTNNCGATGNQGQKVGKHGPGSQISAVNSLPSPPPTEAPGAPIDLLNTVLTPKAIPSVLLSGVCHLKTTSAQFKTQQKSHYFVYSAPKQTQNVLIRKTVQISNHFMLHTTQVVFHTTAGQGFAGLSSSTSCFVADSFLSR